MVSGMGVHHIALISFLIYVRLLRLVCVFRWERVVFPGRI